MASRQWSLMNSRGGARHRSHGFAHFLGNRCSVIRLSAAVRGHACTCHAAHPVGIGQHGIQAECLGAGDKGTGPWWVAKPKVAWITGPECCVELTGARGLSKPGTGQALCVVGDEAQLAAGVQSGQVNRIVTLGAGAATVQTPQTLLRASSGWIGPWRPWWHQACWSWCQKGAQHGVLGWAESLAVMAPAR